MDFLIFKAPILIVQASLDGILLGLLFALIAYGMALQWGVMNIINIAQGDLVILGGYIAYSMYLAGIHPGWGVIVSPIIMFFVGWGLYKLVINKVYHSEKYKWDLNAGYGTRDHINAIRKYGVTRFHRKTFNPIHNILSHRKK